MEKMSLSLSFGSRSTKKRGRGVLVCWCLTLVTFLTVWPISSIADAMSASGVEGWRFLITILRGLSDCG